MDETREEFACRRLRVRRAGTLQPIGEVFLEHFLRSLDGAAAPSPRSRPRCGRPVVDPSTTLALPADPASPGRPLNTTAIAWHARRRRHRSLRPPPRRAGRLRRRRPGIVHRRHARRILESLRLEGLPLLIVDLPTPGAALTDKLTRLYRMVVTVFGPELVYLLEARQFIHAATAPRRRSHLLLNLRRVLRGLSPPNASEPSVEGRRHQGRRALFDPAPRPVG